jgi:hypothetical protein
MLRDVFYYGKKPNVHPKEQPAKNLVDARKKATTEHFWVINEFCDYTKFDWNFDFEFLSDGDVWAEEHNNVWPSKHQKDSGTWLCTKKRSDVIVYRCDVEPLKRKNIVSDNWKILENINIEKWDFSWHPDPTDPPFVYKWGSKYAPAELNTCLEYTVEGATDIKYMNTIVELLPNWDCIVEVQKVDQIRWDMSWRPDPMDPPFIYVWGNKYVDGKLKSTLEYHVPNATEKKYMNELVPVLPEWDRWDILHDIDKTSFDFCWRPDPREPDYIYVFGNEQYEGGVMPTVEYRMPLATERKYLYDMKAKLSPHPEKFEHLEKADGIDYSWVPDPTAPPYIYAWGNQWNKPEDKVSIQYVVDGATEYRYMEQRSKRKPSMDNWIVPDNVDTTGFDFSWEPSPADPAYIYEFGTQWQKTGGPRYIVEGATEVKYVEFQKVKALSTTANWSIPTNCDVTGFDFSWHPDSTSPPYTYHFATQWALTGGPIYNMEGATEVKYVEHPSAIALPSKENWEVPSYIDSTQFDFSWHPYVEDQPYVYQFGTQHQKTGGPRYVTPGVIPSSPIKYVDTRIISSVRKPNKNNFAILNNYKIKNFDWSWHPDDTDEPYIYVFGNTQHPAEVMPTIEYAVAGATQVKYVSNVVATLDVDMTNWEVPSDIDTTDFDFTWKPNPKDPAFIYQFGTQWQKTGGPRYVVPDADEVKYVTTHKVKALVSRDHWTVPTNIEVTDFDFSWHPDDTSPPYIYYFATQWALSGGPIYTVPGATEVKYVEDLVARALPDKTNWEIPESVDKELFDYSWHPYVEDEPYIYQFGTQHQKTGGPRYITPGTIASSPIKYIDTRIIRSIRKPSKKNFAILNNYKIKEFDWSWHPDETDEPYIYVFGNNQYPPEIMPTIEYVVPGAKQIKYVYDVIATLGEDKTNWVISSPIDESAFDFSWKPNPKDPPYIYRWGNAYVSNKYKPTVEYHVSDATEIKYMDDLVNVTPEWDRWIIPSNVDVTGFDFSWRPDPLEPNLIWQFGTQWQKTGGPTYTMPDAVDIKYIDFQKVRILPNSTASNWELPKTVDVSNFDFSWHPDDTSPPYIYHFATQWALTGGPVYTVPGATETKYLEEPNAVALVNKDNWEVPDNIDVDAFDFSWHPYVEDQPYIYQFGTQWQKTGGPRYITPGVIPSSPVKYIDTRILKATRKVSKKNFAILNNYKIKEFDWSWHPDETDEPYIYVFGNTQHPAEIMPTVEYVVTGAKQIKYINDVIAVLDIDITNWEVPSDTDTSAFDFSWKPNPKDPAFIYQFGTQWQKTGGPRYVVPGADEVKYVTTHQVTALPTKNNWTVPTYVDTTGFDFSWHPDDTSPPYIYHFATQWALTGGPIYTVSGATETKYLEEPSAVALPNKDNWEVPDYVDISDFDFSWHPYVEDQPYVYQFGTQWQKTGGPRYVTPGVIPSSPIKYIDTRILKSKRLPNKKNFAILNNYKIKDFDWAWHPDDTDEPYIYVFGNTQHPAEIMPTVEYVVPGAKQIKYINDIVATLDVDMTCWNIPNNVDITDFDFSWKPNPKDPAFIYEFGTQWQKTGGPRYVVPDATEVKYVTTQHVTALANHDNWTLPANIDVTDFDFSWHPDATSPPYNYHFATQWALSGGPIYKMNGAIATKYMDSPSAKALPNKDNWEIPTDISEIEFDFSWHPYAEDDPYIYQFGTQWQKTGGPRYVTPGAKRSAPVKYIDTRILTAKKLPTKDKFTVLNNLSVASFDWSWHPDETDGEFIYVFGNTQYSAEVMPTIEYRSSPYAEKVKYVNDVKAVLATDLKDWEIPTNIDVSEFDFSWKPNPNDPPYIYQFGTQWQKTGGPKYSVEGATEIKYVEGSTAKSIASKKQWIVPATIDSTQFDFSWHPDETEELYVYQFGTQWQKTGGPKYITTGSTSDTPVKYCADVKARQLPNKKNFNTLIEHEIKEFDYSWHPDDNDKPYIYVFGNNQYSAEVMPTVEYIVPGAVQTKYVHDVVATLNNNKKNWEIPKDVIAESFDFSWLPHPKDPPYIYQFGTQWQKTGGPRYVVPEATDIKYITESVAKRKQVKTNWVIPAGVDTSTFDFSWHPDELAPPYIYQFGTVTDDKDGPRYVPTINNSEVVFKQRIYKPIEDDAPLVEDVTIGQYYIETTLEDLVNKHPNEIFWALNPSIDYKLFDFAWRPEIVTISWESDYVHVFGSPDSPLTQTYFVNAKSYMSGKKDFKFVENIKLSEEYLSTLFVKPDMFFVDRGNSESSERFALLKSKFGNIQKTRYLNSWVDTINRCINRSSTELCWILNSELDYSDFDFHYYPNPWQMKMVHVFGTQWSHWGTTFIVNRDTFSADTKYIKIIEHLSNLNFVKDRIAKATNVLYDVYYIDHGNSDNLPSTNVVPYDTDYFTTFKNILSKLPEKKEQYIWIASTVCDYEGFDFTYICDPFAREQLHVFPSDRQKFGDTFLVNVNKLRELIDNMESLKDYDKINFNQHQRTKRLAPPTIVTEFDTHVASVMQDFDFPYAVFVTEDNKDIVAVEEEPMSLWNVESKNILITSTGGTRIVVPKEAKQYVETQLYDYPYIKTSSRLARSNPLDIVYLSNGESCAEENYEHLLKATKGLENRIVRVDGVNGRVQAYHAAAEASNTPWMFTVFAKLKVNTKFDFNWQPDRLQIPKHYMFLAKNPVNNLIYGHQGMIAYNKQMTLDNTGYGLDFTLDSPHETVELLSGIATYNTDEWSTWRTAFREVIKLKKDGSDISLKRLEAWMTKADGNFAQYSLDGAHAGIEYYHEVDGKIDKLKLSYEWAWLRERFNK